MSPASDPSQLAQYYNTEQLCINKNDTKMSNFNTVAPTFWDQHEAANFAFQEVQLLNIIAEYSQTACNILPCRKSSLGGGEYSQEPIITTYQAS